MIQYDLKRCVQRAQCELHSHSALWSQSSTHSISSGTFSPYFSVIYHPHSRHPEHSDRTNMRMKIECFIVFRRADSHILRAPSAVDAIHSNRRKGCVTMSPLLCYKDMLKCLALKVLSHDEGNSEWVCYCILWGRIREVLGNVLDLKQLKWSFCGHQSVITALQHNTVQLLQA